MNILNLFVPDLDVPDQSTIRWIKISGDGNDNSQICAKSKVPVIPVYTRCLNCDVNFPSKYQFDRHHCEFIPTKTELKENDNTDLQNGERIPKHEDTSKQAPKVKVFDSPQELVSQDAVQQKNCKRKCKYCLKIFKLSRELKQHIKSHEGNKPHICTYDECSARFTVKASLKDHYRKVHTRERPFKCDVCDKRFLTGSVYYQHRLIHRDDRRYGCEICGKKFLRGDAVKKHRLIHSGERPYPCDKCARCFRQKCDLTRHVKTQHRTI